MQFDKPVLLYGAGREAHSTRRLLADVAPQTAVYVTSDDGKSDIANTQFIHPDDLPAAFVAKKFGLIVKSPGVSKYKPIFDAARAAGIPVTSNLNLWARHYRNTCTLIAITGTKGKSTTATLVHLMLTHAGLNVGLAGNVGLPPADIRDTYPLVVLELSSYQTADMDFAADIAAITNLYPEHIDWHGSTERYYADKLNLISQPHTSAIALSTQAASNAQVRAVLTQDIPMVPDLDVHQQTALSAAVAPSRLKGAHNLDNARLAARIALAAGGSMEGIFAGISAFQPLAHRLEEHQFDDLIVVDDSISTTPEATKAALNAYKGHKIALIVGGFERQQDYADLVSQLPNYQITDLVCLPTTGTRIAEAARKASISDLIVHEADTLAQGMDILTDRLDTFDTIILSPAAPSYNQFRSFEDRGDHFLELARKHFGRSA